MNDHTGLPVHIIDARIEALELKLMHLENTVHELNQVILQQYRDIERLQLQQMELLHRSDGANQAATASPGDELPPHY